MSETVEMVTFCQLWHAPITGGGHAKRCVESRLTRDDAYNLATTLNQLSEAAGDPTNTMWFVTEVTKRA